jgi:hypothetical protein
MYLQGDPSETSNFKDREELVCIKQRSKKWDKTRVTRCDEYRVDVLFLSGIYRSVIGMCKTTNFKYRRSCVQIGVTSDMPRDILLGGSASIHPEGIQTRGGTLVQIEAHLGSRPIQADIPSLFRRALPIPTSQPSNRLLPVLPGDVGIIKFWAQARCIQLLVLAVIGLSSSMTPWTHGLSTGHPPRRLISRARLGPN